MKSPVFFIRANRNEGPEAVSGKIEKLYLALGLDEKIGGEDFVALKIHFGEKGNTGYIKPEWLEKMVRRIRKRTHRGFSRIRTLCMSASAPTPSITPGWPETMGSCWRRPAFPSTSPTV